MFAELGLFALILAFLLALAQGAMLALPVHGWVLPLQQRLALTGCGLVAVAFGCLALAFLQTDFSVLYVARHANELMPWYYRLSAVWGAHEGSMLMWLLMLAVWGGCFAVGARALDGTVKSRALGVLGVVNGGFMLFVLATSSPFARSLPFAPAQAGALEPLLQDPGLALHPPMLYLGYVGFAVPFAMAVGALIAGRATTRLAAQMRPWVNAPFAFLTLGIAVGSWWAYAELGWGGWWFWDPVENASLLPWITAAALLHSLAATARRGLFLRWSLLLAIITFSLSLLGAFLVRSGVLTSVHSFAADPGRGLFLLLLLLLYGGGGMLIYALRLDAAAVRRGGFAPLSRDGALLFNNLLLSSLAATVLVGTLYPLAVELAGASLSVGAPYFNLFLVLLGVPMVLAMALVPMLRWRRADVRRLVLAARWPLAALALGALVPLAAAPGWRWQAALGTALAFCLALPLAADLGRRLRRGGGLGAARGGMALGHLGVAVLACAIGWNSGYAQYQDVRLAAGGSHRMRGYEFVMVGYGRVAGPNYNADEARIQLYRRGRQLGELRPQKRHYPLAGRTTTEAAIVNLLWADVYAVLGERLSAADEAPSWSLRLHVNPMIGWLWAGAALVAAGALLALAGRRIK